MLLAKLLYASLALQVPVTKSWYGPQEAMFNIQYAGNPYDPDVNDVRVRFVNDNGLTVERLGYFDRGAWKAVLVAPLPGRYKATLIHNGKPSTEEAVPQVLLISQKLPHGFIHADRAYPNRFRYDDGTSPFPMGFDLGWQSPDILPMQDQIKKMGAAGITWTRIWADYWDNKNPWWPQNDPFAMKGQLWPKALQKWDRLAAACSEAGVNFQFVLFHHGEFSSRTDPNWQDNPWNAAKGGFLKDPTAFFTDSEAKKRAKMWMRYAVARWAGNPNVFAWELFNEVQFTDAGHDGDWQAIDAWHKEMSDYIKTLDPYGHLVTTSSKVPEGGLWAGMDCYEPHQYGDDLPNKLSTLTLPGDKPVLIGEFGPGKDQGTQERTFIRDVVWDSIRRNEGGAAMYWYWDRVEKRNLYPEFAAWAKVIDLSNIGQHALAKALAVSSTAGQADGLREIGWLLVRLRGADGKSPRLSWSGLIEGAWDITSVNLDTGDTLHDTATARNAALTLTKVSGSDVVLLLHKVSGD